MRQYLTPPSRRTAVITGASGGLGAATARALAQDGFDLVQMLRSDCADIAAETGRLGISCSVLSDADVTRSVKTAMDSFGRIDAAVFGAGRHSEIMQAQEVPPPPAASKDCFDYDPHYTRDFFDIPWAAWRDDYDMMVLAPMRLAKAVLPLMRAARSGSFVAISGIEAGQPRLPFPLGPTRLALQDFIKLLADR